MATHPLCNAQWSSPRELVDLAALAAEVDALEVRRTALVAEHRAAIKQALAGRRRAALDKAEAELVKFLAAMDEIDGIDARVLGARPTRLHDSAFVQRIGAEAIHRRSKT